MYCKSTTGQTADREKDHAQHLESWASQGIVQVLSWRFALQTHVDAVLQDTR